MNAPGGLGWAGLAGLRGSPGDFWVSARFPCEGKAPVKPLGYFGHGVASPSGLGTFSSQM